MERGSKVKEWDVRNHEAAGKQDDRHPLCTDLFIDGPNNQASSFKLGYDWVF